ncbi:MAG: TrkH family potassium uptake protein [Firmicutes bacterium]|nr:TrkH family potassium uptake protein [Bacillota bacterium]
MKKNKKAIRTRTGQLIVTLVWLAACVLGALFYLISGTFDNFIDAFFESSSGFTTTGATVITDLSSVPGYVLLIRSLTHWLGGMGIVVLFAAIIPSWGIRGQLAAYSETPGPDKGKFTAKFADTAKELYLIYMILSAALILLLKISDMSWLDSITTAFSTIATGGFTNYNDNASGFSVQVKIILIVFMYIAGVNFNLYYRFRRQGIKVFLKDQELRFYTIVMAVGALLIFAVNCWFRTGDSIGYNLLDSFFHVVSVNTTTGFTFGNYDNWPTTSRMILFCFFFIGGCASSTAGGIKVSRILICLKLIKRSFSMRIHPYRVSKITINEHEISSDIAIKATGFVFIYMATVIIGTLLISINGLGFMTSFSCAASCLGNIGPGFGLIGPAFNYSMLNSFSKLICSFLMIAGRLEIYTVLVLFSKYYWNPDRG